MSKQELETVLGQLRKVISAQRRRLVKKPKQRVFLGANACLREMRAGKLELCIIPVKQSAALVEQFTLSAKAGGCDLIWTPELSPKELGNALGLPNTCAMAGFPGEDENEDDLKVRRVIETLIVKKPQPPPVKMQRLSSSST